MNTQNELRPVPGTNGAYLADRSGNIYGTVDCHRHRREEPKLLKLRDMKGCNAPYITIYIDGDMMERNAAQIMLETWGSGPAESGDLIEFIDGNRHNLSIENLRVRAYSPRAKPVIRESEAGELCWYPSLEEAARKNCYGTNAIRNRIYGRVNAMEIDGCWFRFASEEETARLGKLYKE